MLKFSNFRLLLIVVVASLAFQSVCTASAIGTRASKCQLPSYVSFNGRLYHFETELLLSQPHAKEHCQKLNMELVSIEDCKEDNYLTNMIKDHGSDCSSKDYWLSGYRKNNNFYWGTGAPLTYTNWKYGEPNNRNNQENCVNFRAYYLQFNDESCDSKLNFICESANNPKIN